MTHMPLTNWHGDGEEEFILFRGHINREECNHLTPPEERGHWDEDDLFHGYARNVRVSEAECGESDCWQIVFSKKGRGAFKVTAIGNPNYQGSQHLTLIEEAHRRVR